MAFGNQTIVLFCVSVPYICYMLRRFGGKYYLNFQGLARRWNDAEQKVLVAFIGQVEAAGTVAAKEGLREPI